MNIYKCLIILVILTLCLTSVSNAGEKVVKNGVIYITNSDVPSQGTEVLKLKKLWSIGGEDEKFIFRSLDKVLLGRDNNLYVLDSASSIIYVLSLEDGNQVRMINFFGEGPGEMNRANTMFLIKEDQIALLSTVPSNIVCIDYYGLPGDRIDLYVNPSDSFAASQADWENGNLVVGGRSIFKKRIFLAKYSNYGDVEVVYESKKAKTSFRNMTFVEKDQYFSDSKPWDIDMKGRVYFAPYWSTPASNSYMIKVYGLDDKLERVITRKFKAYKRSKKEKEKVRALSMGDDRALQIFLDNGGRYIASNFSQDVLEVLVHSDGNIWVKTSRSILDQPSEIILTYDVFSPQGYFIKQVSLLGDNSSDKDVIYFISEGRVILVKGQTDVVSFGFYEEADKLEIICYSTE